MKEDKNPRIRLAWQQAGGSRPSRLGFGIIPRIINTRLINKMMVVTSLQIKFVVLIIGLIISMNHRGTTLTKIQGRQLLQFHHCMNEMQFHHCKIIANVKRSYQKCLPNKEQRLH